MHNIMWKMHNATVATCNTGLPLKFAKFTSEFEYTQYYEHYSVVFNINIAHKYCTQYIIIYVMQDGTKLEVSSKICNIRSVAFLTFSVSG